MSLRRQKDLFLFFLFIVCVHVVKVLLAFNFVGSLRVNKILHFVGGDGLEFDMIIFGLDTVSSVKVVDRITWPFLNILRF